MAGTRLLCVATSLCSRGLRVSAGKKQGICSNPPPAPSCKRHTSELGNQQLHLVMWDPLGRSGGGEGDEGLGRTWSGLWEF